MSFIPRLLCLFAMMIPPAALRAEPAWRDVAGVRIPVPPAEHPRLFLRAQDVPDLHRRMQHPALRETVEALQADAKKNAERALEWAALQYLLHGDREQGLRLIEQTAAHLRATQLQNIPDACRLTGRTMVTGAVVYDWLYPLFTAEQRELFRVELLRLAHTLECGYPPTKQGAVTGHTSEEMLMRDLMSAGIALYDEFPEMYELAARRFFREHLPARNWFYPGGAYHQGDSYSLVRYGAEIYPLWIFARMGYPDIYHPSQRDVPYHWIYSRRPDGQRLRSGDTFYDRDPHREWGLFHAGMLAASYYRDPIILGEYLRGPRVLSSHRLFEFLWRDPDLEPRSVEGLPLARYFGAPFGWMIARTGWHENAAVVEMKVNEYNFVNHQHLDAGAFQIYHRGSLAIDSGLYQGTGGSYGSPHDFSYFKRTVAHNTLLIHDPKEAFPGGRSNDGGQRAPNQWKEARTLDILLDEANGYRTGKVLAHGFVPSAQDPDLVYLVGDITRAYSDKVRQVVRSFVYLHLRDENVPAALVVFDRVVAADPQFRKSWLLHSLEEPTVRPSSDSSHPVLTIDRSGKDEDGRLVVHSLLPGREARVEKVGGPGQEFAVQGVNYPNVPLATNADLLGFELGAWRIEVSPATPAEQDHFLHVLLITHTRAPVEGLPVVNLLRRGTEIGCRIGERELWFDANTGSFIQP